MVRVSSTEFSNSVGRYQDAALTQPVIVTRNGRDRTVLISAEEYRRLLLCDQKVNGTCRSPGDMVEAIHNAALGPVHDNLYGLIEDEAS